MSEAAVTGSTKKVTEYTKVTMSDGTEVSFAGKQRLKKTSIINDDLITIDGNSVLITEGAIASRFDLVNGQTITVSMPPAMIARFASHGALQKYGDACVSSTKEPLSEEDMFLAIEELAKQIAAGDWTAASEGGGGVSGANLVVRAMVEVSGKSVEFVKDFINKTLERYAEAAKTGGPAITRREYYSIMRAPGSPYHDAIKALEAAEAAKKTPKVDASALAIPA